MVRVHRRRRAQLQPDAETWSSPLRGTRSPRSCLHKLASIPLLWPSSQQKTSGSLLAMATSAASGSSSSIMDLVQMRPIRSRTHPCRFSRASNATHSHPPQACRRILRPTAYPRIPHISGYDWPHFPSHLPINHTTLLTYITGGDVNLTDEEGDTPLYTVEDIETAQFLVQHGAAIDHRNAEGVSVRCALSSPIPCNNHRYRVP